jgi:hypothetical protein
LKLSNTSLRSSALSRPPPRERAPGSSAAAGAKSGLQDVHVAARKYRVSVTLAAQALSLFQPNLPAHLPNRPVVRLPAAALGSAHAGTRHLQFVVTCRSCIEHIPHEVLEGTSRQSAMLLPHRLPARGRRGARSEHHHSRTPGTCPFRSPRRELEPTDNAHQAQRECPPTPSRPPRKAELRCLLAASQPPQAASPRPRCGRELVGLAATPQIGHLAPVASIHERAQLADDACSLQKPAGKSRRMLVARRFIVYDLSSSCYCRQLHRGSRLVECGPEFLDVHGAHHRPRRETVSARRS